jgi:hypothetical protein
MTKSANRNAFPFYKREIRAAFNQTSFSQAATERFYKMGRVVGRACAEI